MIVWFTGRPAAGKTTVATAVVERLQAQGRSAQLLDGDVLRREISQDLGFSRADRDEQVRRAAMAARALADTGVVAVVALVSPFREARAHARALCAPHAFLEVYVDAPLDVAEARDPKGLYRRARRGEIAEFTGIDSPYETPESPDLRLDAAALPPASLTDEVMQRLR
ncbi:adenylyl-sulfate kinase [Mitsuaria sp. 7]|uniref:adenylyl-sulfate kinase n=1 Tax=Mitsuaria sp. 7 TaxID=1658665 RepID=UPI000829DA98|nr:adenylyl-sulfate kinase [Mitsuaria sp. 7]